MGGRLFVHTAAGTSMIRIDRIRQKLAYLAWGGGCLTAALMIEEHKPLVTFQEQTIAVRLGACLGLVMFGIAATFSAYLLMLSLRTGSNSAALYLLPFPLRKAPSSIAFRAVCGVCAASFLALCALFLHVISA